MTMKKLLSAMVLALVVPWMAAADEKPLEILVSCCYPGSTIPS